MNNNIDKNSSNIQEFIREKNIYIQEIIENTIVSIQQHKKNNLRPVDSMPDLDIMKLMIQPVASES